MSATCTAPTEAFQDLGRLSLHTAGGGALYEGVCGIGGTVGSSIGAATGAGGLGVSTTGAETGAGAGGGCVEAATGSCRLGAGLGVGARGPSSDFWGQRAHHETYSHTCKRHAM